MGKVIKSILGGVLFYTLLPIPVQWVSLERVARWAPIVGILLGGFLGFIDQGLTFLRMPIVTRSGLIVVMGIALTGGLHLDGVMDSADGLGVKDDDRRLEIMQQSTVGAFGVLAAIAVLGLKVVALSAITSDRLFLLALGLGWARWAQVLTIALYPYLKSTGKGAFHQQTFRNPQDLLIGLIFLLGVSGLQPDLWRLTIAIAPVIVGGVSYWFADQFKGYTGDTLGAIVEWSEALFFCLATLP